MPGLACIGSVRSIHFSCGDWQAMKTLEDYEIKHIILEKFTLIAENSKEEIEKKFLISRERP